MYNRKNNIDRVTRLAFGLALVLTTSLVAGDVAAQGAVRAWGMGGAHTAAARGLEAVEYNPANLAFSDGTSIGLLGAAVDVKNNSISLDRYNEITGAYLDEAGKAKLLSDIPDDGFNLNADVRASALGLQVGSFALSFGACGAGQGNLDKDYFDLALFGNEVGETVDFSNTWGEGYAYGSATLSWGSVLLETPVSRVSFGLNAHYLQGIYEMHVDEAYGSLSTTMTEVSGEAYVSTLSAEGGSGYGLDLGLAMQAPAGWTFGLVVDNLYTKLDWNRNVERNEFRVTAQDLALNTDDFDNAVVDSDTSYTVMGYSTSLPRRLRLGAANRFGSFDVAVDYVQGLESRAATTTTPQLNVGTEWWLSGILQPRFGVSLGGNAGSGLAAGFGLRAGFWRLDLAAVSRGTLRPGNAKGVGLAVGTSLEF